MIKRSPSRYYKLQTGTKASTLETRVEILFMFRNKKKPRKRPPLCRSNISVIAHQNYTLKREQLNK